MEWLSKYRFGFDFSGLVLFLLVMLPNFIWFAVPAQNDVLRTESATPIVDTVASVFQVLTIACLCFVINKERSQLRFSPLVIAAIVCVAVYYAGWASYYLGIANSLVIIILTIPPCLAFILFAADRKHIPAALFATVFVVCHLIFAMMNFISR